MVANIDNDNDGQNDEELEHIDIQKPTNNTAEVSDTEDDEKAGDKQKDDGSSAECANTEEHDETTRVDSKLNAATASSLEIEMDEKYGARKHGFGLRPRRKPNYGVKEGTITKPSNYGKTHPNLQHTSLTQYSIKKGLRFFGEKGADAVVKEMEQLDQRDVIEPKRADMLTRKEKKDTLEYFMFLKKKMCGRINGQGCADGRKQGIYKTKEETSAPTVAVESLFLSSVIDAEEKTRCSHMRHSRSIYAS